MSNVVRMVDENGEEKNVRLTEVKAKYHTKKFGFTFLKDLQGLALLTETKIVNGKEKRTPFLTGEAWRVLVFLVGEIQMKNLITTTQSEVAEALGITKQNVSKQMKLLVEKEILKPVEKKGRSFIYEFNHKYLWVGSGYDYDMRVKRGYKEAANKKEKSWDEIEKDLPLANR